MHKKALLAATVLATAPVAKAAKFETVFTFNGSNGSTPISTLVYDNNKLYGTAGRGSVGNYGTLFSFDTKTKTEATLASFDGTGATNPNGLIRVGNTLYFVGEGGGAAANGTVSKFALGSGKVRTIYSFQGATDGKLPEAVLYHKGVLYGTTVLNGQNGPGTIFAVNAKTGAETIIHQFANGEAAPGLLSINGKIYGAADEEGANGDGAIFSYDPKTQAYTTLYSFTAATDGATPNPLVYANGVFYGTTEYAGSNTGGTAFSFDLKSGHFTTLYSFSIGGKSGNTSFSAPTFAVIGGKNVLLGTNVSGGANGTGVVWEIDLATNKETTLHSFATPGPSFPVGPLLQVGQDFYGTTADMAGGDTIPGSLFKITP